MKLCRLQSLKDQSQKYPAQKSKQSAIQEIRLNIWHRQQTIELVQQPERSHTHPPPNSQMSMASDVFFDADSES